jgi:hypothetical protein
VGSKVRARGEKPSELTRGAGVWFPQPSVGSTKGGPEPQGHGLGILLRVQAEGELPAAAAVRRGWGGRADGRASSQSAELGSRRGARRRPQPPTVCKPPALGQRGAPHRQQQHQPGSLRARIPSYGSAARLGGSALGNSQVKLLLSPQKHGALGGRRVETEGAAAACSRPPLRPYPFAFIRGDKSAVKQPAFQFTDNDSCMKIDRGALHRRALSPPALLLLLLPRLSPREFLLLLLLPTPV